MSVEFPESAPALAVHPRVTSIGQRLRELAPQDWMVATYLTGLNIAVWRVPPSPGRDLGALQAGILLAALVTTLILVRGGFLRDGFFAPLLYRAVVYGTVQATYFLFHHLLPLINPSSLDRELYELDLHFFGIEPALAFDSWVGPVTTEWFAFFYFGYFFILALHVLPILFFGNKTRVLDEFGFGMVVMFCLGHTIYMFVPGFGPFRAMADQFTQAFPSGMWVDLVRSTVARGGAQKDIFPSLHTAAPMFIALLAYRHRDKFPFKYTWPVLLFCSWNIIAATMFLRWHYVIDVIAGLLLALISIVSSARLTAWDLQRREQHGLSASWPVFFKAKNELRAAKP